MRRIGVVCLVGLIVAGGICCVSPGSIDQQLNQGIEVIAAADRFYQQHDRWPQSLDELNDGAAGLGSRLDPADHRKPSFTIDSEGSLTVRWKDRNSIDRWATARKPSAATQPAQ
jgi:hypothetical protein